MTTNDLKVGLSQRVKEVGCWQR